MSFIHRGFCAEDRVPVGTGSVAKIRGENKTAFLQPKVVKRFTTCRTGEAVFVAFTFSIVGSSTLNIQEKFVWETQNALGPNRFKYLQY